MRVSLILLLLVPSLGVAATALSTPPPSRDARSLSRPPPQNRAQNRDEVIRLGSRLVLVPVSASDASGRPVRGLTADDFVVEEEGRPQQIVALGEAGNAPVEIALLFDVSASIHARFIFEQQAAVGFLKQVLKPGDSVSLFSIGSTPKLVRPRTSNIDEAIAGLMAIRPSKEPTAFFDSTVEAALHLGETAEAGSRRVLVVISDGEENYSTSYSFSAALQALQANDSLFYSINPTGSGIVLNRISMKGQSFMEAMSLATGGKAFQPERPDDLEAVFSQIIEELQAQYLFGYYSTDEAMDGAFRRIAVRAPGRPELRIRARQGYYAAKP